LLLLFMLPFSPKRMKTAIYSRALSTLFFEPSVQLLMCDSFFSRRLPSNQ
jgi:hypothetical protein